LTNQEISMSRLLHDKHFVRDALDPSKRAVRIKRYAKFRFWLFILATLYAIGYAGLHIAGEPLAALGSLTFGLLLLIGWVQCDVACKLLSIIDAWPAGPNGEDRHAT
jgi:hypothetical protein